jgi:hypothetical protein
MTLEELQKLRDAVPDDGQLPATATQIDLTAVRARRALLDHRVRQAHEATAALASLGHGEADAAWLHFLTTAQETLEKEWALQPARIKTEQQLGIYLNLRTSLKWIVGEVTDHPDIHAGSPKGDGYELINSRLGQLMVAAGYDVVGADPVHNYLGQLPWFGSIKETKQRIAALAARRAQATTMLEDALMNDDERARQVAETEKLRVALNGLRLRGPKLLVQDRDEEDLSPLEKEALAWARAAASVATSS